MRFTSLTRHAGIGANSYLLECDGLRLVLDAGMDPRQEGLAAVPLFDSLEPDSVDAMILSHAHLDHTGTLPLLTREQADMPVLLTPATAALAKAMLHNSVNVMQAKRTELGITEYPLYGHRELDQMVERFHERHCERPFEIGHDGRARATFHDAGHILGSAGATLEANGKRLFYSGDVNFEDQTLIKGALFPTDHVVDALVLETTRGENPRAAGYTRRAEENRFAEAIAAALARGGSVLVPVFAMGKTQEVLAMIHRFKRERRIHPATPVRIGGLSTKMTLIHDDFADDSRRCAPGFRIFERMEIETGGRRGAPIPQEPGCLYVLSSGMMSENTVSNRFAAGFLANPRNAICFVGYCDPETPGYRVKHSQPGEKVVLDPRLPAVARRCDLGVFDFSGHAPREHLLDFACRLRPRRVFLVHGDAGACRWFREALAAALPDTETIVPQPGVTHAF
jgi:Cft2 family RNA processing exonuclease